MTPPERQALLALCEAATPGPWSFCESGYSLRHENRGDMLVLNSDRTECVSDLGCPCGKCGDKFCEPNAAYIAAGNPETVEALLLDVERLEAENETQRAHHKRRARKLWKKGQALKRYHGQVANLASENDRLDAALERALALAETNARSVLAACQFQCAGNADLEFCTRCTEVLRLTEELMP